MTNNPTIDGVSRDTIRRALSAVMSNNTSHWSSVLADELRALLDAPAVERQEPVTLAGLLEKNTIVVKVDVYDEQQATIARLEARITQLESETEFAAATYQAARDRIAELESGRGEIAGFRYRANGDWEWMDESPFSDGRTHYKLGGEELQPLFTAPPAPVATPEKYDDVLMPFLALMRAELHANAHKGDRPGWLQMDSKTAVLEVFYHMGKLHQAVHRDETAAIKEYAADVANMCMMLLDVCACLDATAALNGVKS